MQRTAGFGFDVRRSGPPTDLCHLIDRLQMHADSRRWTSWYPLTKFSFVVFRGNWSWEYYVLLWRCCGDYWSAKHQTCQRVCLLILVSQVRNMPRVAWFEYSSCWLIIQAGISLSKSEQGAAWARREHMRPPVIPQCTLKCILEGVVLIVRHRRSFEPFLWTKTRKTWHNFGLACKDRLFKPPFLHEGKVHQVEV